jgi:tetratricopeptide (TPR) repeat protein
VLATLCFVLALLAKPSAVALPLVALLLDRFVLRRPLRRSAPLLGLWFALALALVLVTKSQQTDATIRFGAPVWARPLVALDALAFYLEKTFWPVGLVADYGRQPAWLIERSLVWFHGLVPLGLAAVAASLPGRRWTLPALGIFAAAIAPVSGIVPFHFQDISTVADRYAYVAMLGPALAVAALVAARRWTLVIPACAALAVVLGALAFVQAGVWRDTESLFRRSLEWNPSSVVALVNVGVAEGARGDLESAAARYRRALEIDPDYPVARGNLGGLLVRQEKFAEAVPVLRETLRRAPDYPFARKDLAIALVKLGRLAEAEQELKEGLALQPGYYGLHLTFAQLLYVTGRFAESATEFERTVEIFGNSADGHQGLAMAYAKLGKAELSERHRRIATALRGGP